MKTVAIIPCRDEAKHIADVVTKARRHVDTVMVIDDGSIDGTALVASGAGAIALPNGVDYGFGAAVIWGLELACKYERPDIIVLLDGDGQHDPEDIPALLSPIVEGEADVVMGIRTLGNMPKYRRFGNKVLTWLCNFRVIFKPADAVTGYWAISFRAIPKLDEKQWGLAIELLIKTRRSYRLCAVPVKAIYHGKYEDNSTISPIRLGMVLLWMIIKWRFKVEVFKQC